MITFALMRYTSLPTLAKLVDVGLCPVHEKETGAF